MKIQIEIKHLETDTTYLSKTFTNMEEEDIEALKNIFTDDSGYIDMETVTGNHVCMSPSLLKDCVKRIIVR